MHVTTRMNLKPLGLVAIIFTIGLVSAATSLADHKGKPHGKPPGGDPPPTGPVSFEHVFLGTNFGLALEINNSGVVVGRAGNRAFRVIPNANLEYDPDGDGTSELIEDLNDLGAIWVDEAGNSLADQNWTAVQAKGINEPGEIVGTAIHNITGETRAFLFNALGTHLMLLPTVGPGSRHESQAINNDGDIVGFRVDPNDSQISTAIFYKWDATLQVYLGWDLGVSTSSPINFRQSHLNNRVAGMVRVSAFKFGEG